MTRTQKSKKQDRQTEIQAVAGPGGAARQTCMQPGIQQSTLSATVRSCLAPRHVKTHRSGRVMQMLCKGCTLCYAVLKTFSNWTNSNKMITNLQLLFVGAKGNCLVFDL